MFKNYKNNIYVLLGACLVFLLNINHALAQDIHFSNWQMSPINVNPANTGRFDGNGRLIFNYRNQWKSVPVPYNTFSFGSDFNLNKSIIKKTNEAVGIVFNHDASGDGKYQITDVKVPVNHKFSINADTSLQVSVGFVLGLTNININSNKLSYDKQWDGDAYNSGLNNGESFVRQSKTFGDVGLGTVIEKSFTPKIHATVGYSINHLNQPNVSFYNTALVKLRIKHSEFLQLKYNFSNISSVMFEYYGNQQQKFRENILGLTYFYTVDPKTNTTLNFGILTRIKDALIATAGLQYNSTRIQASYDYNYSQFKAATNGRGGFELSVIYIWSKPKVFVPKRRVCPIYM